ncbi:hypothetical protein CJP73_00400 [Neopusillimonas maritima]|uniref:Phage head morphogenesis domain-containing protein n=1 Tax=Neopusillimonas maritima TaxID=2026239 RepID=A0A3A1YUQ5_9BURK|nr:hypothetical protein CJP73_00400 [Neopusillimonas maritima]
MLTKAIQYARGVANLIRTRWRMGGLSRLDEFILDEVRVSMYIRPEAKQAVSIDILDTDPKTYRLANDVLTREGVRLGSKRVLTALRMNASHRLSRIKNISRISDAGFPLFSLMASNDERDCAWCKANNGKKLPIDTDINWLIKENCTCEYCRCTVRPHRR